MTCWVGTRRFRRVAGGAFCLSATLLAAGGRPASASCNLIPQTAKTFDSVLGSANRPFAAPGEQIEVRVRPCDVASRGFTPDATDNITVVFTPPSGPSHAVVLTAGSCSPLTAQLATCDSFVGSGNTSCVPTAGAQIVEHPDGAHLQFPFPDTDNLVGGATDQRTLAGPAAIAVTRAADPLPCQLATASCAAQTAGHCSKTTANTCTPATQTADCPSGETCILDLIVCVDEFFSNDGTCTSTTPQGSLNNFTALPPPNDFGIDCGAESPPCHNTPGEFRLTTDKDGNLLLPVNWQRVLVRQNGTLFPRLVRALLSAPAPVSVGPSFTASLTPEGGPLAPIFVPQVDPTTPRTVLNLFGSADATYTVLRVARRSATFQQCVGGAYTTLSSAVPCNSNEECPAVCDGGTNPGQFCTGNGDCTGGGSCGAAGTCGPTVCFGGSNGGGACTSDANCPGGECGPSAFNAGLLGLLAFNGVGPILLPHAVDTCLAGSNATSPCTSGADCPGGICVQNGICQQTGAPCGPSSPCSTTPTNTGPCVQYALGAENPIPLLSLAAQADQTFALTAQESVDGVDRNGDSDASDFVVTLRDRATGIEQFLGAPAGCSITGTPEGRAVVALHQPPFLFPAVATQGGTVAFLESEPQEGFCDENGDTDHFDSILRVFKLGPIEITAGLSPVRVVDADPVMNVRSVRTTRTVVSTGLPLAVSNGVVYYRRSEAEQAHPRTELVSNIPSTTNANGNAIPPVALSADGRFVAFVSNSTGLDPNCAVSGSAAAYVRDRSTGTTECESRSTIGAEANAAAQFVGLSADGRFVVFDSTATNLVPNDMNSANDVFLRDRCVSNGTPVPSCTPRTERVSVTSAGAEASAVVSAASVSDVGRFVPFASTAPNLTSSGVGQSFVRDRFARKTIEVSVSSSGAESNNTGSGNPVVSGGGRFVVFESDATNLDPVAASGFLNVYVHDLLTGQTELDSVSSTGGEINGDCGEATLSADGRFVAFECFATNLVPGVPPNPNGPLGQFRVYVRDRLTERNELASIDSNGLDALSDPAVTHFPTIAANGRFVIFSTGTQTLVPNDTNTSIDLFVHDRLTGMTELVSRDSSGLQHSGDSGAGGSAISADGHVVAFPSNANLAPTSATPVPQIYARGPDPNDTASDITGDGDHDDTVLEQLDSASSIATTLCPADQVAVAAGSAAFLRPEAAGTTPSLPGCPTSVGPPVNGNPDLNNDGDATDEIVHFAQGGTVQNLQLAATYVSMSGQCTSGSNVSLVCDADSDCPGGSCAASWIAALASEAVPGRTELEVHQAAGGNWTDVGQAADVAEVSGALVAFITPEAMQGADLNGDHDKTDRVIQVYDADAVQLTNLGQAAEEFVIGTTKPDCALSPVIAFRTSEAAQNADLNGDGDTSDFVLQLWAKGLNGGNVINTGQAVTPCRLPACDPRQPYQVNGSQIKFLTREVDQGQDLNGDGQQKGLILQVLDVCSGDLTVVGAVDEAVTNANPLTAAGNTQTAASVVVTGGNRCFTTGTSCTSDADCTAPSACISGFCATVVSVPASCATSADCPGASVCLADQVVAAPEVPPAQHDSVLLAPAPLTITIPKCKAPATSCSVTKLLKVGLRNADIGPPTEQPGHTIEVAVSDGTCPPGTVSGHADINKSGRASILLAGGKMATAAIPVTVSSDAFTTFSHLAPSRCTLQVAATTVLNNGQDNRDPSPSNNTVGVELNVIDKNDAEQSTPHESTIASVRPLSASIPPDKNGQDANSLTKTVTLSVGNADVVPAPDTDPIAVTASDGTCPVGTVVGVNFAPHGAPPTNTAIVTGGRRANGKLTLNLSAAGFATHNAKAPSRCTVQVTATGPSNPDASPSNNTTNVVIDVTDKNDF